MERSEIFSIVQGIIADYLGIPREEIKKESRLIEDLNLDSLDTLDLLLKVESKIETNLSDINHNDVITVDDIVTKVIENAC